MGVANVLRTRRRNNGQKVYLPEIDAGGRPENGILLGVALSCATVWIEILLVFSWTQEFPGQCYCVGVH